MLQSRVTSSGITVNSQIFFGFLCFFFFLFCCCCCFVFFRIVVFSYLVWQFVLFYFILRLFYFIFGLFVYWFPFMSLMCFLVSLVVFSNCCQWEGGFVLSSFCIIYFFSFFKLFLCMGKGYFNSLVGRVRDSSSAGQSMT